MSTMRQKFISDFFLNVINLDKTFILCCPIQLASILYLEISKGINLGSSKSPASKSSHFEVSKG